MLWNVSEIFGIFWNLLESFEFFWNLLESFGFFCNLLEYFESFCNLFVFFWNLLEFLSSLVGLGLRSSSELLSSSWSILGALGLESISSLVLTLLWPLALSLSSSVYIPMQEPTTWWWCYGCSYMLDKNRPKIKTANIFKG